MAKVIEERDNGTRRVSHVFEDESRTEQSHRSMSNINTIVAKARMGSQVPVTRRQGMFGDFTSAIDFHSALGKIQDAQNDFNSMPAKIRAAFNHDPGRMIDALSDPKRYDEMADLGLVEPRTGSDKGETPPNSGEADTGPGADAPKAPESPKETT